MHQVETYWHVWYADNDGNIKLGMACKLRHESAEEFRRRVVGMKMKNGFHVKRIAEME